MLNVGNKSEGFLLLVCELFLQNGMMDFESVIKESGVIKFTHQILWSNL